MRVYSVLVGVFSLLFFGVIASATNRLNLPQMSADLTVDGVELQAIFDVQGHNEVLTPQLTQTVLSFLPKDFRNGCHDMVPDFGPMAARQTTWAWTVRVLDAESDNERRNVLLALRCTIHVPDVTFYDERLAVFSSSNRSRLKLIPLDQDCTNCSDVYHLKFLQKVEREGGYLAELGVEHTTENPCCDGGDTDSGERWVLVSMPSGTSVLSFDKEAYHYNHDDEGGDTETKCDSTVSHERDARANLRTVVTKTTCTENGKVKPPVTTNRYVWNESSGRFDENLQLSQTP
jgi:hypothetical protein